MHYASQPDTFNHSIGEVRIHIYTYDVRYLSSGPDIGLISAIDRRLSRGATLVRWRMQV